MADISSYLAAIMAAVYGEDVRGSIHDAIDIINKVGEVVLNTGTAVTGPTSSSTGFYDGSFYINTNTMELWKCIGTNAWQSQGVLKGADGADGNGIVSIVKTATVGLVDTYTITFDDGSTETYQITNGQNGSKWYKGTAISGTGTSITGFPGTMNDFYLNSTDGYVYICTKTGGSLPPDAAEWDYVMTLTGGGGSSVTVIDNLISTSSTDALSANQGRVLNTNKIDNPSTKSDGQVLTYNAIDDEWEAQNPSGGGMLPYLYIDSEAGSTVTVNQPDGTTITPTAAGSGHWECELTGGYGTYVIHSVLPGQGDATQSLVVDTVMEYHVTDTHYDHTVSFVAPSGSTVRIEGGTEIYTLTGTGSTQTQAVHSASTSFTVTATMDGNGKPYTFTTPSTTGQTTTIPSGTFDFGTINVSVAADFVTAGSTITCAKTSISTISKTAASTLTFRVPDIGEYTISGSVGGQTYTTTATVTALGTPVSTSLQTLPEGSTVLPTDDIQTWLNCAGIYNKTSYTTLADVLGDATTLLALMSDNNAVDYLVRSTTWATDVCADSTAMTDIGANNYCADTLLDDADWLDAICNSTYIDSVLNVKIPTLSAASPSVTTSGDQSDYEGYKAFNNQFVAVDSTNHGWLASGSGVGAYIRYMFDAAISIKKAYFAYGRYNNDVTLEFSGSNDGTTWTPIQSNIELTNANKTRSYSFLNSTPYTRYQAYVTAGNIYYGYGLKIQLYGREDV